MTNQLYLQASYGQYANSQQPSTAALQLYRSARAKAWLGKLGSRVTGRSQRMPRLEDIRASSDVRGSHYAGLQQVPIDRIRGSEGREAGFDANMYPTEASSRGRWMGIAAARRGGVTLPPVSLIQVGDVYFVRDGHHRVSVAKALGEEYIGAEVTVLELAGALPGKRLGSAPGLALQPA